MLLLIHLLLICTALPRALSTYSPPTLTWKTTFPTPTKNQAGQPIVGGGMPVGNGRTTAYVFVVDPADAPTPIFPGTQGFFLPVGISIMVDMPAAMASDGSLFGLGMISIDTVPSMFAENDWRINFQMTLNASEASVTISTNLAQIRVWVDATTNLLVTSVNSKQVVELVAQVQSLRPTNGKFEYAGEALEHLRINALFPTSNPDIFLTDKTANTLTISHRNVPSDKPAYFNDTLRQQGLGEFVEDLYAQGSDRWSNRQFGMLLSGENLKSSSKPDANGTLRHLLVSTTASNTFRLVVTTHANQTETDAAFQKQLRASHHRNTMRSASTLSASPSLAHLTYWLKFWSRSHIVVTSSSDNGSDNDNVSDSDNDNDNDSDNTAAITEKYAWTRYLQTIQIQGGPNHWIPIKFNGLCFTTQLPPDTNTSGPAARTWGPNSWWQNTRLPYGPMLGSGDLEDYTNVLEFILQMVPFAQKRTMSYFQHKGIYFLETKTLFGSYRPADYGDYYTDRVVNMSVPYQYILNSYIRYGFGGDGGTTEVANMVLDYYEHTFDEDALQRYSVILIETLVFYSEHFTERQIDPTTGKLAMRIFPTQALETYWCASENSTDTTNGTWTPPNDENCITNDHPTVVSLHVLVERSQRMLPTSTIWTKEIQELLHRLEEMLPSIPLIVDEDGVQRTSPYENYPINSDVHNGETPELYGVHPFRHYSLGRSMLSNIDISPALQCATNSSRRTCSFSTANGGWTQGILNAALLGLTERAKNMIVERAQTPPAIGYRFLAFAPHEQDYEPSADHYANHNMALQWMILQPADDVNGSMILFGAWPCEWDVEFKLHGPRNTTVTGKLVDGMVVSLEVEPKERKDAVINVLQC